MPLVHECGRPGCSTLTMGELCLVHEAEAPAAPARRPPLPLLAAALAALLAGFLARARLTI